MEVEFDSRPVRPGSLIWSEDNILALVTPACVNIVSALEAHCKCGQYQECCVALGDRLLGRSLVTNWMLASQRYLVLDQYLSIYWGTQPEIKPEMADKLESVSLAWSPKIHFGGIGSVLALGNKAGHVTLWHVTSKENVRCIEAWKTGSETWVIQLSWSPWVLERGRYVSMLAYATADGQVRVREAKFNPELPLEGIEVSENVMEAPNQTLHPCTVLRWSPTSYEDDFLKVDDEQVEFIHQNIISRCHMQTKTNITQDEGDADNANAEDEGADEENSGGAVMGSKLQLHITSGNASSERVQLATAYYVTSPFHMEFQRERYQSSTLTLSKAHKTLQGAPASALFDRLDTYIRLPNAALSRNPAFHMWDMLLLLGESWKARDTGAADLERLMTVLSSKTKKTSSTLEMLSNRDAIVDPNTSLEASQLKRCELEASVVERFEHHVRDAETRVRKHITGSVLALHNEASATCTSPLQDCDRSLLLLLCDSILLFHNDDKHLLTTAETTYLRLQSSCAVDEQLRVLQDIKKGTSPDPALFGAGREECPACDTEIKLENIQEATCANGHTWQRCSVTLLVIADFHPRTCLGCGRKTLMVPDAQAGASTLPGTTATSWLEVVLRAHSLCGYCGERFYTALRRRA
ncbi:putative zinc-finger of transcription factor IIIC complex-domain-containing protein [Linnemannia elongata]|nr:putative zinc-finger of transcription factor IIIC complex-domain-containing protein [Linnemannia elongata]